MEVCVTGGSGYIASHLIHALLQKGYHVRTTVRNPSDNKKTSFLWDLPGASERLRIFEADLLKEGSFDKAIDGVRGVFHVAAPVFVSDMESPEKSYLDPCLKGTRNVLTSCSKSTTVNRVVLTSSCSAIRYEYGRSETDPPLDESCWSNPKYCEQYELWYAWAKTLTEKEAWKMAREKMIDLVVVNPSFVVGPFLSHEPTSTISMILGLLKGDEKVYPNSRLGFVHIFDVVTAHVLAFEDSSASGRIVCSEDVYHWREICEMIKRNYPNYATPTICGTELGNDIPHRMDTTKVQKMGLHAFKSLEVMFEDCITSLKMHGVLG